MQSSRRLLIYSHDSFGLGHLRRCRAIAHDLVDRFPKLSVLILSGSPIIGSFDFKSRVDFVRVPGVIKLKNGDYTSLKLNLNLSKTLEIRQSIITHTASIFDPDMFLVDKEPLGLRGEVEETLDLLTRRGRQCVLGLRDVMDEPHALYREWQRKGVFPALERYYRDIWVYGLPEIFDPITELPGMRRLADRISFTGYIERSATEADRLGPGLQLPDRPYILVTAGGGGDGAALIDWVLSAYETDPAIPHPAVVVFGPFMHLEQRHLFQERADRLSNVRATTFEANLEALYQRAVGVVAMGGYNTFCEILSFDKPALIVPRSEPRREQLIRAERAARLGLVRVLHDSDANDPAAMARCLHDIDSWPSPGGERRRRLLGGLDRIAELCAPAFDMPTPAARSA
jgi:predicted glycosyltransferase